MKSCQGKIDEEQGNSSVVRVACNIVRLLMLSNHGPRNFYNNLAEKNGLYSFYYYISVLLKYESL